MITAIERRLSSFNKEKIMQRCIFIYGYTSLHFVYDYSYACAGYNL